MKLSWTLWGAVLPLLALGTAIADQECMGSVLQTQQPAVGTGAIPIDTRMAGDRNAPIPLEMLLLDRGRICSNSTNVTFTSVVGNITWARNNLVARNDTPPAVWTLIADPKNPDLYSIKYVDPIGRNLYLNGNSGRQTISTNNNYRYRLKIANGEDILIYNDSGCLMMDAENYGYVFNDHPCSFPFKFKKVGESPWKSPTEISPGCALNALKAIEGKDQAAKMQILSQARSAKTEKDLARILAELDDISPAVKDSVKWAVDRMVKLDD